MGLYELAKAACRTKRVSLVRIEAMRLLVFYWRLSESDSLSPGQFSVMKFCSCAK